jgi:hypothetical protein
MDHAQCSSDVASDEFPHINLGATPLAAAILAVMALACFQMLTWHPFDLLVGPQRGGENDLTAYYWGSHTLGRIGVVRVEEFPRWNPYSGTGAPRWGNPQSGCWYPPNWIFCISNAGWVLSWMMVAHQWWGGFGVYLLCRRLGLSLFSGLVGGSFLIAAPYHMAQIGEGHYGQICVAAWIPWALLGYERFRREPRAGLPYVSLTVAMCVLAGHIQEAFYLAVALTLFAALDAAQRVRNLSWPAGAAFFGRWCYAGLVTLFLVAVDFVPTWNYARQSLRTHGLHDLELTQSGVDLAHLRQLLNPFAFGGPDSYVGPGGFYCETLTYFGGIALLLAVIGVGRACQLQPLRRYGCLGLVAFGFAFGADGPVYWILRTAVPGMAFFRGPNRALFFCAFAVAILAAAGFEGIFQAGRRAGSPRRRVPVRLAMTWSALCLLLAVLGFVELSLHAHAVLRTLPEVNIRRGGPIAEFLQKHAGYQRILSEQRLFSDRDAIEAGLFKAHGYEPVPLLNYTVAMRALNSLQDPSSLILGFDAFDLRTLRRSVLDMLGIRYAVVRPTMHVDWECWNLVQIGRVPDHLAHRGRTPGRLEYWILENRTACPRAFVVGDARIVRRHEDATRILSEIDPRRHVLLAADLLPPGPRSEYRPARILEYRANQVTVDVNLTHPGYLFLSDTQYPGWTAEDNGQPVPLVAANIAGRAVPLGPGRHLVMFRFGWSSYLGGLVLSAFGLIVVLIEARRGRSFSY